LTGRQILSIAAAAQFVPAIDLRGAAGSALPAYHPGIRTALIYLAHILAERPNELV
jgi:hypothetical protein